MLVVPVQIGLILVGLSSADPSVDSKMIGSIDASYFEGRWAFEEEACKEPTSWTMIAGGNFVSENLIGTWGWNKGKLVLSLTDMALDEETGETGGRFQMDGPVQVIGPNEFNFAITPDNYKMKRCNQ